MLYLCSLMHAFSFGFGGWNSSLASVILGSLWDTISSLWITWEALWQRWLCNDKVVVCYAVLGGLSWGFNSAFTCTIISRCVCDPDTHNIHRGSPFWHILFWFVFSSFVSFKNLFEWIREFSNTITSMETELLCHYGSSGKGHMTKVRHLSIKRIQMFTECVEFLRSTKIQTTDDSI